MIIFILFYLNAAQQPTVKSVTSSHKDVVWKDIWESSNSVSARECVRACVWERVSLPYLSYPRLPDVLCVEELCAV